MKELTVNSFLCLLFFTLARADVVNAAAEDPILCRSLAEVRQRQSNGDNHDFLIDAEFSLAFASARYETIYVQEGQDATQVFTDQATSAALSKLGVASRIRISGIFSAEKQSILLRSYDIISDERSTNFDRYGEFGTAEKLAINGLAMVPFNVMESFLSPHSVSLFGFRSAIPIEVKLFDPLPREDVLPWIHAEIKVCGALLVNAQKDTSAYFIAHSMHRNQFPPPTSDQKLLDHYRSGAYQKKYFDEWKGQVLFTDNHSFLLLGLKDRVIRVSTRFAHLVTPGDLISVLEWRPDQPASNRNSIQSRLMERFASAPLPEISEYGIDRFDAVNPATNRLTVDGRVVSISADDRICRLALGTNSGIVNVQTVLTDELVPFSEGDLVQTAGTPWASQINGSKGTVRTVYVPSMKDIHLKHRQIKISDNVVWGIGIGTFLFLGLATGWTQSLRIQVAKRTQKLNQMNSQLSKSFEAIRFAILLEDSRSKVASLNSRFSELATNQVTVGDDANCALSAVASSVNDEAAFYNFLNEVRESRGESCQRNFLLKEDRGVSKATGIPVIDSKEQCLGYLWIFEDITESVRYQEQLLQSQKLEAVGQLSSGFAHDFNNILTIIRSSLAMIRIQAKKGASFSEYVESADDAVSRAALITTHLLDYCRLSHLSLRTVDLNKCVENAHLLLRRSVDLQVTIDLDLSNDPLYVIVDEARLEQVILNLGINARDSFHGGNGRISFSTNQFQKDGNCFAVLTIEDNGIGMPQEVRRRAFEPFFTTKGPGKGTGLGLSMAQGIVEQLNGFITCDSDPLKGTIFKIFVPEASTKPILIESQFDESNEEQRLELSVLIIDDESSILKSVASILSSIGCDVVTAQNGHDGLALLRDRQDFDVIILDLNMHGMGGMDVLKAVKEQWPWMRVIVSSGYSAALQDSLHKDLLKSVQLLPKPYTQKSLVEALLNPT